MSQEELALRSGVSLTYISRLENGRSNPSYKILERIALVLGVSSVELLVLAGVTAREVKR